MSKVKHASPVLWRTFPPIFEGTSLHYSPFSYTSKPLSTASLPSTSRCSRLSHLTTSQYHIINLAPTLPSPQPNFLHCHHLFISPSAYGDVRLPHHHCNEPLLGQITNSLIVATSKAHLIPFPLDYSVDTLPFCPWKHPLSLAPRHDAPLASSLLLLYMLAEGSKASL